MAEPTNTEENPKPDNPDAKLYVWPKAFDHALQSIINCIFEARTMIELYQANTEFGNVMVTHVVKPKCQISVEQGMLKGKLDNARFNIRADETILGTVKTFVKTVTGSFTVDIIGTETAQMKRPAFNVRISLSCSSSPVFQVSDMNNSASPSTDEDTDATDSAGVNVTSEVSFEIEAVGPDVENGGKRSSEGDGNPNAKRRRTDEQVQSADRRINEAISDCLLHTFTDLVMEKLNGALPVHALPPHASNDWRFNFGEMSMPAFQDGYISSEHVSVLSYRQETIQGPTPASPFPLPINVGRMLTIFISSSVFNSIGYCFHRHSILSYNLTQDDFTAQATQNDSAKITSGRAPCLSDCFPEFSTKYPGASVEVSMSTVEAPTARFSGVDLKVTLIGSAIFRALLPDGKRVDLVDAGVTMETVLAVKLEEGRLVGSVVYIYPGLIAHAKSDRNAVDDKVLKEVIVKIGRQFLTKKFNEIAKQGIPLPRPLIPGVLRFQNTLMRMEENYLRVDTDLMFRS